MIFHKNTKHLCIVIIVALFTNLSIIIGQSNDLKVSVIANTSVTITSSEFIHYFSYVENSDTNIRLWRYMGMRDLETNEVLVTSGDSEGVYKIVDGIDFTGGYHGDEELTKISFVLDETDIELNKNGIYYGNTLKRFLNSDMYTVQNNKGNRPYKQVECNREHILEITRWEYKYFNKFMFVKDQSITDLFLGMYCIGPQFSNIMIDNEIFIINETSPLILKNNVTRGTWKYPERWEAILEIEYINTPEYFTSQLLVLPAPYYNKAYFGMYKQNVDISINDVFETKFSATYSKATVTNNFEVNESLTAVYLNPTSKVLKLKSNESDLKTISLSVFDIQGRKIKDFKGDIYATDFDLNICDLKKGMYLYILEGFKDPIKGKFIITK